MYDVIPWPPLLDSIQGIRIRMKEEKEEEEEEEARVCCIHVVLER